MAYNVFGWGYPAGAENDPDAPYNQEDSSLTMDCTLTYTLTCDVKIDLQGAFYDNDCEGASWVDTDNCDVQQDFESQHYTPMQLLAILKAEAQNHINKKENAFYWGKIAKQCSAWEGECTEAEIV